MTIDADLIITDNGYYDIQLDSVGDIKTQEFFTTAILYSLFGERRASPDEIVEPVLRRGWIGNSGYENGSKLWLLYQARLTTSTLNRIEDEAVKALQWLVDDGFAVSIDEVNTEIRERRLLLELTISRSRDEVFRKSYDVWENTIDAN